MADLSFAQFVALTDKIAAAYYKLKGTSAAGLGMGDNTAANNGASFGALKALWDAEILLNGYGNTNQSLILLPKVNAARLAIGAQIAGVKELKDTLNGLDTLCSLAGSQIVAGTNWKTNGFASYYNTDVGGPNNALLEPNFRELYNLANPSTLLSVLNCFSPPIASMATYTGTGAGTISALSAVNDVDQTNYGGAAVANLHVTTPTGTGLVTITGKNQNNVTGRTWTVNVTGAGDFTLVPTVAGDLLVHVSAAANAAGLSAGTFVVQAQAPAGRTSPPS